jgi:OOP family OmpA-OmpF porin
MKKISLSLVALFAMGNHLYAGGVFTEPVYITEDLVQAEEVVVEAVQEEIYVAPMTQEPYIAPPVEKYIAPMVEEEIYVAPPIEEYVAPMVEEIYVAPPKQELYVPPIVVTPPPAPPTPKPKDIVANGLYVGAGLSVARFEPSCTCPTGNGIDKTGGVVGRIGYDINQYIGIEARGIRTNWKSDGGKVKHYGVFVKPMYPISKQANLYGLAGYAKTKTEGSLQKVNAKTLAWGAGIEYDLSEDSAKSGRYSRAFDGAGDQEGGLGVFADYERLIQKSDSPDLDTVNIGLTYDF